MMKMRIGKQILHNKRDMDSLNKNFIKDLKTVILQSRYQAARVVNKELISLYFNIGRKISVNTNKMAWGSKILEQISNELQNELPGLKGFSATNLQRMTSFYEFWQSYFSIYPTVSGKLKEDGNQEKTICPTLSDQFLNAFFL